MNKCNKCGEQYKTYTSWYRPKQRYKLNYNKWCEPCQINYLKRNFTNWTSGNEKIDNLIQEMQLKIDSPRDIVFEWIPYSQFNDIKEIGDDGLAEVYSAIWKDGPLHYSENKYARNQNENIGLKCLYNSQNFTGEFLNKV